MQVGSAGLPPHMLRKARVKQMLIAPSDRPAATWAALVFTCRQASCYVLNDLVARLPTFASFLATGAHPGCSLSTARSLLLRSWSSRSYQGQSGHRFSNCWSARTGKSALYESLELEAEHWLVLADALMGNSRWLGNEQQERALALFRKGHVNTLFTTSVAEEGLDVQHCSLVICYDVPNRPLSLVQTVGRARARNARVIFLQELPQSGGAPEVLALAVSRLLVLRQHAREHYRVVDEV